MGLHRILRKIWKGWDEVIEYNLIVIDTCVQIGIESSEAEK